jgi:hypothetical protein
MNYEEALRNFLLKLEERENKHIKEKFSNLTPSRFVVDRGRKFDKIVKINTQETVYAFIKKENGAILKPASWRAPEPKQYERGNIFNDNPLEGTGEYGVNYRV